jgi:hypothetical protein
MKYTPGAIALDDEVTEVVPVDVRTGRTRYQADEEDFRIVQSVELVNSVNVISEEGVLVSIASFASGGYAC